MPFRKLIFFTLFFINFLDVGGIAIILVVFPSLIIPTTSPFLDPSTSLHFRNILLGFLMAAFPLTQFFGAPILGELSDRMGRKKILIASSLLTALSFGLTSLAIMISSLKLLFLSRLIGGFFSGTGPVSQASISELVEEERRPQFMAFFAMLGGISWIVWPFLGALLANKEIVPWFSPSIPLMLMGIFFLFSALFLFLWKEKWQQVHKPLSLRTIARDFIHTLTLPKITIPLTLSMTVIFAWMIYNVFITTYLMERFSKTSMEVGILFTFFSFCWFIGGGVASFLLKRLSPEKTNILPLFIVAITLFLFGFAKTIPQMMVVGGISHFFQAISISCFFGIFSHAIATHLQGKVFGVWTAGLALSSAVAAPLAGWVSGFFLPLPFILAALIILICAIYYKKEV